MTERWFAAVAVSIAVAQPMPPALTALAAKAHLDGRVTAWCSGQFRPGRAGAFAVGVTSAAGGGRYVVLEANATLEDLAPFTGLADLACYTRAEAEQLDLTIGRSDTVDGRVVPRWNTTVVCAFVDATTSVCWQFDPGTDAFVKIGGWVT